jgi:hypothetical protein
MFSTTQIFIANILVNQTAEPTDLSTLHFSVCVERALLLTLDRADGLAANLRVLRVLRVLFERLTCARK